MIKNYFKTAIAHLLRNKSYSVISILSLTVGLAVCLLLLLYVQFEWSYDRYHKNADLIYRLCAPEHPFHAPPTAKLLADNIPEIKSFTRILPRDNIMIAYKDKRFKENKVAFSDPDIFSIFSFNFRQGNPEKALREPLTIVLSEKAARKYFGNEDPIGKVLKLNNAENYTVAGVMEDMPQNSHFRYDIIGTLAGTEKEEAMNNWGWQNFFVYFLLTDQSSLDDIEAKCSRLMKNRSDQNGQPTAYTLQNLKDVHLWSAHLKNDSQPQNSITYVLIFSAIGFLVLLISCFNYINLLTANATTRLVEIGMRKACGASRAQIIMQYISESVVVVFVSFCFSVLIVCASLPVFNELTGKDLSILSLADLNAMMGMLVVLLIIGILAGWYPAFVVSSYNPVRVFLSSESSGESNFQFRKILVGAQFTIVTFLLAISIIMFRQIRFLKQKDLGFRKEYVLTSDVETFDKEMKFMTLKRALLDQNFVVNVSAASRVPSGSLSNLGTVLPPGQTKPIQIPYVHVHYDYFNTLNIKAFKGRLFLPEISSDSSQSVILNEAAVKSLGIKGDPIGQTLKCNWPVSDRKIVGVVKDFHFESLYETIKPAVFVIYFDECWQLMVKVKPGDVQHSVKKLDEICKKIYPDQIFDFRLLDVQIEQLYQSENKTFQLMGNFAILAIILAGMGLFGIATFFIIRRQKEIGIRKVNGATALNIMQMLNLSFLKWIAMAFVIATPVAYYVMIRWLESFAYRTAISWWIFVLAGFLVVCIALLTVSWQSWRAATRNPVETLRSE